MPENVIQELLDRIHAVNLEIKTVETGLELKPSRYFVPLKDAARLPIIFPVLPPGEHDNTTFGSDARHSVFSVPIWLYVDNFLAGSGPEDAQKNAEKCLDHILNEYWNRPRLELKDEGALEWVMEDARLTRNTELQEREAIAIITFTLVVATERDMERL